MGSQPVGSMPKIDPVPLLISNFSIINNILFYKTTKFPVLIVMLDSLCKKMSSSGVSYIVALIGKKTFRAFEECFLKLLNGNIIAFNFWVLPISILSVIECRFVNWIFYNCDWLFCFLICVFFCFCLF